jgi:hypothetical protein
MVRSKDGCSGKSCPYCVRTFGGRRVVCGVAARGRLATGYFFLATHHVPHFNMSSWARDTVKAYNGKITILGALASLLSSILPHHRTAHSASVSYFIRPEPIPTSLSTLTPSLPTILCSTSSNCLLRHLNSFHPLSSGVTGLTCRPPALRGDGPCVRCTNHESGPNTYFSKYYTIKLTPDAYTPQAILSRI